MVRKIFALASVSALAGIITAAGVAGCSDDPPDDRPDTGPQDGGPDGKPPKGDADAQPPDDTEDAGTCVSKTDVDTSTITYKKARVQPSSCTEQEAAAIAKYIADKNGQIDDIDAWKATVGAKCAACVFSDGKDSWSPINVSGNNVDDNAGGCMEVLSGKTECGAAYQRFTECPAQACKDCGDDEYAACRKKDANIYKTVCKAAVTQVQTECGAKVDDYIKTCFTDPQVKYLFEASVTHLCVLEAKDSGGN